MKNFTNFNECIKNLEESFKTYEKSEFVNLTQSFGRILAVDIVASENSPKKATSSMDGYAIKFSDQDQKLRIIGTNPAGSENHFCIKNGECVKTFTGSIICDGSDTLVPIENVKIDDGFIKITQKVNKNFAVRPIGESYKKDQILLKKGTKINYAQMAILAELNIVNVEVFIKPKVAIIATGSEIVDVGEIIKHQSQIRSSNHIALAAICHQIGAAPIVLGLVGDDKDCIKKKILNALKIADIVVTTGGVSVGEYDFVKEIIQEVEPKHLINGCAIKPGRHIKVVKIDEKYIFALPGFPFSAIVGFYLFGVRLIEYWLCQDYKRRIKKAILDEDYEKKSNFSEFSACNLTYKNGECLVDFKGKIKGSSAIVVNLLNDARLIFNQEKSSKKGEIVEVLDLE